MMIMSCLTGLLWGVNDIIKIKFQQWKAYDTHVISKFFLHTYGIILQYQVSPKMESRLICLNIAEVLGIY